MFINHMKSKIPDGLEDAFRAIADPVILKELRRFCLTVREKQPLASLVVCEAQSPVGDGEGSDKVESPYPPPLE